MNDGACDCMVSHYYCNDLVLDLDSMDVSVNRCNMMERLVVWLIWLKCLLMDEGMVPTRKNDYILLTSILNQAFKAPMPEKHELLKKKNVGDAIQSIKRDNRKVWEMELLRLKYKKYLEQEIQP